MPRVPRAALCRVRAASCIPALGSSDLSLRITALSRAQITHHGFGSALSGATNVWGSSACCRAARERTTPEERVVLCGPVLHDRVPCRGTYEKAHHLMLDAESGSHWGYTE